MKSLNMDQFVKERDTALLSMNRETILAYLDKYSDPKDAQIIRDMDDESFWVTVHKARTGASSLPLEERVASSAWLKARGYSSLME